MPTFLSSVVPGIRAQVLVNNVLFPMRLGYMIGTLNDGDKVAIEVEVSGPHQCYFVDHQNFQTPKTPHASGSIAIYRKTLRVTRKQDEHQLWHTSIAGYPNNVLCVEINHHTYQIGIFCQYGQLYFCIHETVSTQTNQQPVIGTVLSSNPLQGIAIIAQGNDSIQAFVRWTNMPYRPQIYFRGLLAGEIVTWDQVDRVPSNKHPNIQFEIIKCQLSNV